MAGIRGVIKWAGVRSRCSERAHPRLIGAGRRHPADAGAASEINAPAKPVETPPRRPWTRVRFPPPPPISVRRTPAAVHYTAGVDQPADILTAAPGVAHAAGLSMAARPRPAAASASLSRSCSPPPASSSCSRAAGVPAGHRADGPLLITLTVASALSLALLWWSPLAGLCVSLRPARARSRSSDTSSPRRPCGRWSSPPSRRWPSTAAPCRGGRVPGEPSG